MFKEGMFTTTMIIGTVFGTALSAFFFVIGYRILNK